MFLLLDDLLDLFEIFFAMTLARGKECPGFWRVADGELFSASKLVALLHYKGELYKKIKLT
jgi:hypothetical protein